MTFLIAGRRAEQADQPAVSPFTQRVYDQLPQAYRDADETSDYPLLRWLSLLADQGGEIETLLDRIGGTETSALVDPDTADVTWLPWLGQLVGVQIAPELSEKAARDAVRDAPGGYLTGTRRAVAAAAQSALTGTRSVRVFHHSISSPGDGGQWDVLLVTGNSETPDPSLVLAAVVAKGAKPVGVVLHHRTYLSTWAEVQTAYPTWATRNGKTWLQLEEIGL